MLVSAIVNTLLMLLAVYRYISFIHPKCPGKKENFALLSCKSTAKQRSFSLCIKRLADIDCWIINVQLTRIDFDIKQSRALINIERHYLSISTIQGLKGFIALPSLILYL
jgi:hypothetical protein